jgi:hypothetical protein
MNGKGINNAALILFGQKKIDEFLPGSKITLEWRNNSSIANYGFKRAWRESFF